MMNREFSKWLQTFKISWSRHLAYKINFFLLVIGPTTVFFFVKYNLWSAIYAMDGVTEIQGYDFDSMLAYQVWVMIVTFLAQGYNSRDLSEDIRLGRVSSYLIYPFEFWKFHTAGFIAFQIIQIFIAAVTLACVVGLGFLPTLSFDALFIGFVFALVVGCLWFSISYLLGLVAFWLEETWVLRVMFLMVAGFLSGAIIPLEIYPSWIRNILDFTPFPYMTFVPAKIFMSEYSGDVSTALMTLIGWTLLVAFTARSVWNRGIKLYTAAGM